ncbi:hypothetical protein HH_0191 [Helicobacter hepaticus ATCC 51449]|uniref:Uncharacterized protein n=1 Tax=Helicobacter hepaticus (strain ATCC 51449 / 3B1) TaxID=235279 RepID=Q7VJQ2_HELHP|nr:hypothetical protein HH_0191 [Helicobacter hepaticus ATCC 51449]
MQIQNTAPYLHISAFTWLGKIFILLSALSYFIMYLCCLLL